MVKPIFEIKEDPERVGYYTANVPLDRVGRFYHEEDVIKALEAAYVAGSINCHSANFEGMAYIEFDEWLKEFMEGKN